ncbi:MAG: hypothetical protein KA536_06530 [Saprospiraceae bacterium]|nr:hypothetical protein [Saprospiraceae bacterium]
MNFRTFIILTILSISGVLSHAQINVFNEREPQIDTVVNNFGAKIVSIAFIINNGNSFFHNSPFIFDNCPNCYRKNQRELSILDLSLSSELKLSVKNGLLLEIGISQFGFKEDHYTSDNRLFKQTPNFGFFSIKTGHTYQLCSHNKLSINMINILSTDIFAESHLWLIRRINFSYILGATIEYKVCNRMAISLIPNFRQSIINYNRVVFDKDYWPYSYGIGIGVKYLFNSKPTNAM